ncbi:MAG: hypothetical protein DSZ07_04030 [Sulfurovum sp.]|nr:MAG: hypothetical protein DSZ07_04030 [Sulfurovum sp.]
MQLKTISLIGLLFIPILSIANQTNFTIKVYESMDIKKLIEEAKEALPEDRIKIESLIRKKIAKAHRENNANG